MEFAHLCCRGFNEAVNGFTDEGWSLIGNDGMDDVTVLVNSSPDKLMALSLPFMNGFTPISNAVLCAKASMLLQVSSSSILSFIQGAQILVKMVYNPANLLNCFTSQKIS